MNEQQPGMQPQIPLPEEERKPVVFAVRIDPSLREQIEGLRDITGQSVNDVGVEALTGWVTQTLSDENVQKKAMAGIEAEERRLQERRNTITGILGNKAIVGKNTNEPSPQQGPTKRGSGQPKTAD